ncbi:MAG: MFS transporter, partial [Proteobacteria bacterium]|nr:MFS transporter [Pseudomonadota bacterium]
MLQDQAESRSTDEPPRAKAALAAASGAHLLHDGMADSLYVLLPIWAETLGLSYTEVGLLRSAYSASMAACQVGAGLLAERLGERFLLAAGTTLAGLAFGALAATTGFLALLVLILLVGFGSSVQHPLASSIISDAYPQARRRAALGVYNFFGDVGKMTVTFAIATAAGLVGWRVATAAFGGLVAAAGIALFAILLWLSLGARHPRSHAAPGSGGSTKDALTNPRGFSLLSAIHLVDSAARTGTLTLLPFILIAKGAAPATVGFAL